MEDVLAYLVAALDLDDVESRVFEIGGPDQVSYGDIMREYARQRGLRRMMISVPVLTPRLSSLWLGLVTPVYPLHQLVFARMLKGIAQGAKRTD